MKNSAILLLLVLLFCQSSLTYRFGKKDEQSNSIVIQWNKSHGKETIELAKIALQWTYSYVGATLPTKDAPLAFQHKKTRIIVCTDYLGLNNKSKTVLHKLHSKIKNTEEYLLNGSIDLGRYISLILGSSEHYYELIGTPKTFAELISNYEINDQFGYVNHSNVSKVHRIIGFSNLNEGKQLFIAQEFNSSTQDTLEIETMEMLDNGQIRFGIYDKSGNRISGVEQSHSNAGKPAKCIWCHESKIQPFYAEQEDMPSYLPFSKLNEFIENARKQDDEKKLKLTDGVDFSRPQDHVLVEICYISFMEPSAERLSLEWNMPIKKVKKLLINQKTHVHEEFPFLGILYDRQEIEKFAPFKSLQTSGNVREVSNIEVNHL